MDIFKKEKQVTKLAIRHVEKVGECVDAAAEALKNCVAGNVPGSASSRGRVNELESEADTLLREIRDVLYGGAYLPLIRGDIYKLLSAIDDVANKSEDAVDFCNLESPRIDDEYAPELIAIIGLTAGSYKELKKALKTFFKPKGDMDELRGHTRKVSELESLIDSNARVLTAQLFNSSAPLADKLHLQMFVSEITRISDVIEDAADELALVSLKSII